MEEKMQEAELLVDSFTREFRARFGTTPKVYYSFNDSDFKISLPELEVIVNQIIKTDIKSNIRNLTLRDSCRKRELVVYRQCTFYVARGFDYGCVDIGQYFGWNHSTIIYSVNNIKSLIGVKDPLVTKILNSIQNELEKRFRIDGVLQPTD